MAHAVPRRPPGPWPIDTCQRLNAQLNWVTGEMSFVSDIINKRTGDGFIHNRPSIALETANSVMVQFASDWNGVVPPVIPLICRGTYRNLYTLKRHAFRVMRVINKEVDAHTLDGRVISNGFIKNRPHEMFAYLRQYLHDLGFS